MDRADYTAQPAPAPEGPGLHSYDAAPAAPGNLLGRALGRQARA
jgi:hypothetical protein